LGLVLSCDMSVAAATARFNTGFVNVGLAPGHGTYYLPRAVGRQRAFEMMVCSDNIPATTAMEMGLINRVVAPELLDSTVNGLVEKVLAAPPFAIAKIKELLNASQDSDLRTHFELEADAISSSAGTEDFKEGTDAFFNKRRPKFKGK